MTKLDATLDVLPGLSIVPLQPSLGAEVEGVDLRQPLTKELRDALYAALLRYRVIFFRDQDITREQQIALGRQFGELEVHPVFSLPDYPEILPLISENFRGRYAVSPDANWHADTTFRSEPSAASVLRQVVSPSIGGDTVWANVVDAYETLDDDIKARIDGLTAIHDASHFAQYFDSAEKREALAKQYPPVEHPVVRVHPETGEKVLYVNSVFTRRIVGLPEDESAALLRKLFDQLKRPEFQVRFRWRVNSIAFWDNRSTQHYAVPDYAEPRHMERVTIIGDAPRGPSARAAQ